MEMDQNAWFMVALFCVFMFGLVLSIKPTDEP